MRGAALAPRRPVARPLRASRVALVVRADASRKFGKGKKLDADRLNAGRQLGSGSFGECYRGTLAGDDGEVEEVVLKRVKARVQGADEMHEAEHLINVLASRAAAAAVAPFLGYTVVEQPSGRLTKGVWLVWAYEGDKTLAYYLKRRDMERCLAADLGVAEEAAVPTAMKQIFECLVALHNVGIVHRDIKPANIVFDESERRFRLIDLGAAACLRTGTNYKPAETILDPCYCPPEEYVLPTDAPHLAAQGTRLRTVMTPVLWTQHRPDCFDTYSAGIVLMQLSLPFLRTTSSLRTFNGALARCKHDLEEWRVRSGLPARQTAILDANNGAGWDLAASLLRPREVANDEEGVVRFLNTGRAPRLSASAALRHPFVRGAGVPAPAPAEAPPAPAPARGGSGGGRGSRGERAAAAVKAKPGSGGKARGKAGGKAGSRAGSKAGGKAQPGGGGLINVWGALKNRFFDLEARVLQEATATEVQTTRVQALRSDVAAGRASAAELAAEESALQGMQRGLAASVQELNSVYSSARGFLSGILGGGGSKGGGAGAGSKGAAAQPDARPAGKAGSGARGGGAKPPAERPDPAAARAAAAASARRVLDEPSATEVAREREAAEAAGAAAGAAVSTAATGLLRLTGSALSGLASFAASVSEQMERSAKQAAAEAAAQKQAAAAYLEALQAASPALTADSTWEQAVAAVPEQPAWQALSERRREQVFRAYVEVVAKAEAAARARALASFQSLLVAAQVSADSRWEDFAAAHGGDERWGALGSDAERRAAFDGFAGQMRAAREAAQRKEAEAAEAAARAAARAAQRLAEAQAAKERAAARAALRAAQGEAAEAAFRALLQEQEGAIAGGLGYAQLKRAAWTDPRFDAVPEFRRRALYREYTGVLAEAGLLSAAAAAAAGEAAMAGPAAGEAAGEAPEEGASQEQLEFLRREQSRLKDEYAKMEAKLRSMEQRLQLSSSAVAGLPPSGGPAALPTGGLPTGMAAPLGGGEAAPPGGAAAPVADASHLRFTSPLPPAAELAKQVAVNGSNLAKK